MWPRSFACQCGGSNQGVPHRGEYHATTILCIRKDGVVAMVGDGQVSAHVRHVDTMKPSTFSQGRVPAHSLS